MSPFVPVNNRPSGINDFQGEPFVCLVIVIEETIIFKIAGIGLKDVSDTNSPEIYLEDKKIPSRSYKVIHWELQVFDQVYLSPR